MRVKRVSRATARVSWSRYNFRSHLNCWALSLTMASNTSTAFSPLSSPTCLLTIYVSYAYGAVYGHWFETLFLDIPLLRPGRRARAPQPQAEHAVRRRRDRQDPQRPLRLHLPVGSARLPERQRRRLPRFAPSELGVEGMLLLDYNTPFLFPVPLSSSPPPPLLGAESYDLRCAAIMDLIDRDEQL